MDIEHITKELQTPQWPHTLRPVYDAFVTQIQASEPAEAKRMKEELYATFEKLYTEGKVFVEKEGKAWDIDRKPIDMVVIHHTGNPPGMTLSRLNIVHLLRLYANWGYKAADDTKIWSGHFMNGEQVFYAYHWLVRTDGTSVRLLDDSMIGWQAGNWNINTRSVAICFDDDLRGHEPTPEALAAAKEIIANEYSGCVIRSHKEVNPKTDCPGELFDQWKEKLQ